MDFPILAAAALIPLIIGFIWYHPKVFGTAWMKAAGLNEESMKGANMILIFGLTYVLGLMMAMAVTGFVIHQAHVYSTLVGDDSAGAKTFLQDFMANYGTRYRTFKHGAFHGILEGLFFALPVLAVTGMFERKGFKYIAINAGYWILTLALMGGVICQFVKLG